MVKVHVAAAAPLRHNAVCWMDWVGVVQMYVGIPWCPLLLKPEGGGGLCQQQLLAG
jgi:hypothetical protein